MAGQGFLQRLNGDTSNAGVPAPMVCSLSGGRSFATDMWLADLQSHELRRAGGLRYGRYATCFDWLAPPRVALRGCHARLCFRCPWFDFCLQGVYGVLMAPLLIPAVIWVYTLAFALTGLWLAHCLIEALVAQRRGFSLRDGAHPSRRETRLEIRFAMDTLAQWFQLHPLAWVFLRHEDRSHHRWR